MNETKELSPQEVLGKILEAAKTCTENRLDECFVRTLQPGQWVRQGDLAIRCVSQKPKSPKTARWAGNQLAIGHTQGASHTVDLGEVQVFTPRREDELSGPIVVAPRRWTLRHAEHSHFSLPSGTYQVTYQRDLDAAERARVSD